MPRASARTCRRILLAIAKLPEDDLRRGLARLQTAELLYEMRLFPELEYTFKHARSAAHSIFGTCEWPARLRSRRRTHMSDGPAEACAIIAASMPRPIRTSFGAARLGEAALAAGPLPQARACAELALALSRAQMSGGDEACRLYLLSAITAREEPVSVTAAEDYCLRGGRTG